MTSVQRESGARAAALYLRCLVSSPDTLGVPLSWYPLPRPLWASFLSWSGNKQLILIFLLAKLVSVFHFQSQPTEFSVLINSNFLVKRLFLYLVFSMSEKCTQGNIWESSATKVKCVISKFGKILHYCSYDILSCKFVRIYDASLFPWSQCTHPCIPMTVTMSIEHEQTMRSSMMHCPEVACSSPV